MKCAAALILATGLLVNSLPTALTAAEMGDVEKRTLIPIIEGALHDGCVVSSLQSMESPLLLTIQQIHAVLGLPLAPWCEGQPSPSYSPPGYSPSESSAPVYTSPSQTSPVAYQPATESSPATTSLPAYQSPTGVPITSSCSETSLIASPSSKPSTTETAPAYSEPSYSAPASYGAPSY